MPSFCFNVNQMTVHYLKKQICAGTKLTFLGLYLTVSIFEIAIRKNGAESFILQICIVDK